MDRLARHPVAGEALARLSNLANHAKLWIGVAATLGLSGGRRGRRAAQRSLLSVALASALTNGLLKPLFARQRPVHGAARPFPFVRLPTSPSYPSGHAASAGAFAVATAMEAPLVAVPVAGLAAAVACSRVTTGVHFPSDVVAGVAVGASVAAATAAVWPRIDPKPAGVASAPELTQVAGAVSPSGEGLTVVVNAAAGPSAHEADLATIAERLPDTEIVPVEDASRIDAALLDAASTSRTLGVLGGDGTINAAARVALDHDLALAVFPGGTLNHFARDLGIDTIDDAIDAIQLGQLAAVDVATIDGRLFLNTASFGTYSEFVTAREKHQERIGKWPATLLALWSVLRRGRRFEMELDGVAMKVWMVFIGNGAYDPPGFAPATRARLDDGQLDVRLVDGSSPAARLRLAAAVLTGGLARSRVYTRRLTQKLTVATHTPGNVLAADGEVFDGGTRFEIVKLDRKLHVHAPHR